MKDITKLHPPIDEKDVFNKEYCDNYSLSSSNKIDWAIPLKKKSGLSIINDFKIVLSEHRRPEIFWVDRGSEFYSKIIKSLLKEYETELYSI